MIRNVLLYNFRGNYYVLFHENICPVICADDMVFLQKSIIHLTTATGLSHLLRFFAALLFGILCNSCFAEYPIYIYYDSGMMAEISFARFSCIIFLAASPSLLFASAHIALTVAVSEIISDRGITPISSKSLPVS